MTWHHKNPEQVSQLSSDKKKQVDYGSAKHDTFGQKVVSYPSCDRYEDFHPAWKLDLFDADGPWGRGRFTTGQFWNEILPKLREYERRSWKEILADRSREHSTPTYKLTKQAQKRLRDIKLDDIDQLFRFRLSARQRLWGKRAGHIFQILWWDPEHEIYPTEKKHT